MRLAAALREKADERRLSAVHGFSASAFAWFEWLTYMADQMQMVRDGLKGDDRDEALSATFAELAEENNRRSKERQQAYRELLLLCSDELYDWLRREYEPLEQEVNRHITASVRMIEPLSKTGQELRRRYTRLLRVDLVDRFRPEVDALRNPLSAGRWLRPRRHVPETGLAATDAGPDDRATA